MSRRLQENLIAAAILLMFVGVIVMCLDYGPRARMVPLPLAIFGLIMMLAQIVWQNLRSTQELKVDLLEVLTRHKTRTSVSEQAGASPAAEAAAADRGPLWRLETNAFCIVMTFLALIMLLGPITAIFVFTGGYFLLSKHYSWLKGLVYTIVFTATVYALFVVALEIQLYHGVLEPLIRR